MPSAMDQAMIDPHAQAAFRERVGRYRHRLIRWGVALVAAVPVLVVLGGLGDLRVVLTFPLLVAVYLLCVLQYREGTRRARDAGIDLG